MHRSLWGDDMRGFGITLAAIAALCATPALAAQGGGPFLGAWTITEARPAPWAAPSAPADPALLNAKITISRGGIEAPAPIGCARAEFWFEPTSVAGLFSGLLTEPERQARELGFSDRPIVLSVSCKSSEGSRVVDFAMVDRGTAMFALDNHIYVMKRGGE
jgi:hypothetical protein